MNARRGMNVCVVVFSLLLFPNFLSAAISNPRETPVVKVVKENAGAVVNISTERILLLRENPYWGHYGNEFDFFFGEFFGIQRPRRALKLKSVGSGVVVDKSGIIVTNAHVVHMASNIFVIFNDGTKVKGKVVYENLEDDLAIVKIAPPPFIKEVKLGQTDDIMIGETVVAIGNPLGLENSVTAGVISGKERDIFSSKGISVTGGLLQTDAPINPGNSGGALLNINGELVGINVAVVQNSQSIGFAIPVEKVKDAIKGHEENKKFSIKHKERRIPQRQLLMQAQPPSTQQMDSWDPFDEMDKMKEEMERMFQGAFGKRGGGSGKGMFNTDIFYDSDFNIEEKKNSYIIKLDIKGVDRDKINIDIHEGSITVSGEHSVIEKQEGPEGYYSSHRVGSFLRTIPLPEDADTEKVKTAIQDEQIVITFPKIK